VPYIVGESIEDRHKRRFEAALASAPILQAWCEYRGIEFTLMGVVAHPNNAHMRLRLPLPGDAAICFWAPNRGRAWKTPSCRTVKAVYEKIHDWEQLIVFCEAMFEEVRRGR